MSVTVLEEISGAILYSAVKLLGLDARMYPGEGGEEGASPKLLLTTSKGVFIFDLDSFEFKEVDIVSL